MRKSRSGFAKAELIAETFGSLKNSLEARPMSSIERGAGGRIKRKACEEANHGGSVPVQGGPGPPFFRARGLEEGADGPV